MWRVKVYKKYSEYEFTNKFVEDILLWACRNHKLKTHKQIIRSSMTKELKELVNYGPYKHNFKNHMLKLSKCEEIANVLKIFQIYKGKYRQILQGDFKPPKHLNKSTIKEIKPVFKYFYDTLLDSPHFWKTYNPTGTYKNKQNLREMLDSDNVCPYCDQVHINSNLKSNMDHFLPVSTFPFLSVFWENIVLSCIICNGNLIKNHKWSLPVLHPYFDDIENVLYFTFSESDKTIKICARDVVKGIKRSKKRGDNLINLLRHNETYNGLWSIVEDEKINIKQSIQNFYFESKRIGNVMDFDGYIENGVKFRKFYLKNKLRNLTYTKLKMDYNDEYLNYKDTKLLEWLQKQEE